MLINGTICQEDSMIIHIYAPKVDASNFKKQTLLDIDNRPQYNNSG
jgi:hypothetical protein